jgi:hypothetical protein
MALVPSVHNMDDATLIKHMQARHDEMIAEGLDLAPNGVPMKLRSSVEWRTFHDKMHELYDGRTVGPDEGESFFNHLHRLEDE